MRTEEEVEEVKEKVPRYSSKIVPISEEGNPMHSSISNDNENQDEKSR